ncbi:response regulator transcription factor [Phenylobacterium montanum]|uniref:response regulator transcription factor n=1 Tax=Phenylobacterium montanum TaxID=2823693 RepID=UPI00201260B1|nr:response regulator transcription factor [Caulobacter sp. S6]
MSRILLVEDDAALSRGVAALLKAGGHTLDCASDGETALAYAADEPYGLIILDIGLPGISGFEVLKALRARRCTIPILVLTARDGVSDKIKGLDLGADDYLLKPFDAGELEARVRALLRRNHGDPTPVLVFGNLTIDRSKAIATVGGRILDLRRKEWAVLEGLIGSAGGVLPKERLLSMIYGFDGEVTPNALEVHIARLRKKLEPDGPSIKTVRGLGYMIELT